MNAFFPGENKSGEKQNSGPPKNAAQNLFSRHNAYFPPKKSAKKINKLIRGPRNQRFPREKTRSYLVPMSFTFAPALSWCFFLHAHSRYALLWETLAFCPYFSSLLVVEVAGRGEAGGGGRGNEWGSRGAGRGPGGGRAGGLRAFWGGKGVRGSG